jgi:ADP-ribose pyrophosphatase
MAHHMNDSIELGERTEIYRGKVITLVEREVDGGVYNVVEHSGASCAVPVMPDGRIVLIRQYRRAIEEWIWEVPAGTLEPGESPEDCMAREVVEEIGWEAERLQSLGTIVTAPGFSSQRLHLFIAHLSKHVGTNQEPDEMIEVHVKDWSDVQRMMRDHEIKDGKSLAALYRYDQTRMTVD